MRNLIAAALVLLSIISLPGCTKVLYTHQEVLDGYKTKDQLLKKFGVPTEKTTANETEEWLYRFEEHNSKADQNVKTAEVKDFTTYKRYLVFSIDKQGNVTAWRGQGTDLTQKVKAPGKTIGLVAGGIALTALIIVAVGAMVQSSLNNSFY